MPAHAEQLSALRQRIEFRLAELVDAIAGHEGNLSDAIRDAALFGGKRLRPMLTVVTCEELGGDVAQAVDAGCAVEMIHAASLILDDLPCMDDAAMRRGQETIHRRYGQDVAILAAIALLTGAFGTLADISADAGTRIACTGILAGAVGTGGLVTGQFRDLHSGKGPNPDPSGVNALKTGSLISAAVAMGGVIGRADAARNLRLAEFAGHLGQAFQLFDDLLDQRGDAASIGKDVGKDVGKATFGARNGSEKAEIRLYHHLGAAHEQLERLFGQNCRMASAVNKVFEDVPDLAAIWMQGAERNREMRG